MLINALCLSYAVGWWVGSGALAWLANVLQIVPKVLCVGFAALLQATCVLACRDVAVSAQ